MEAARQVLAAAQMRYSPSPIDFDLPLDYQLLDGEHDVFGDGQVVLLPTYGHTPGHQSVRVRAGKATGFVLTADTCYTRENMDRDVLPNMLWDPGRCCARWRGCASSGTAGPRRWSTGTTLRSGTNYAELRRR